MKEEVIVSGHGKEWVSTTYNIDNSLVVAYVTTKNVKTMVEFNQVGIQVRYLSVRL